MKKLLLLAAFLLSANYSVFSVNTGNTDRGDILTDIQADDKAAIMQQIAVLEGLLAAKRAEIMSLQNPEEAARQDRAAARERLEEQQLANRKKYGF